MSMKLCETFLMRCTWGCRRFLRNYE